MVLPPSRTRDADNSAQALLREQRAGEKRAFGGVFDKMRREEQELLERRSSECGVV